MQNSYQHPSCERSSPTFPPAPGSALQPCEVVEAAAESHQGRIEELALAETLELSVPATVRTSRGRRLRAVALFLSFVLALTLYLVWQGAAPARAPWSSLPSGSTPVSPEPTAEEGSGAGLAAATATAPSLASTPASGIVVYIVGAVRHPGIYRLPVGARIYQLLQAAGGPLPEANLVTLNLAAVLHDGEEIYVARVGEIPPLIGNDGSTLDSSSAATPAAASAPVNINIASVDELRQRLHVSATTAQNIVNYRLQHGPYTAVEQLLQVVSRSIYDRIKNLVTV